MAQRTTLDLTVEENVDHVVTTGLSQDSYMEITQGLAGGEVVIVEVDKK